MSVPRPIPKAQNDWLTALMIAAEVVTVGQKITACRDPTDDKFLELAVSGKADVIVSGDKDLPVLRPFHGIPMLAHVGFLTWVRP